MSPRIARKRPAPVPSRHGIGLPAIPQRVAVGGGTAWFRTFKAHSGPTMAGKTTIHASFWGGLWQTEPGHQTRAQQLTEFLQEIGATDWVATLVEYGSSGVQFGAASFIDTIPQPLTDLGVHTVIQAGIDAHTLHAADAHAGLMVFLDDSLVFNDLQFPNGALALCTASNVDHTFGYHYYFSTAAGAPFYYGLVPSLTDTCLQITRDAGVTSTLFSLNQTQLQRQTVAASHELAEMITDPEPFTGWSSDDALGQFEVADICPEAVAVGNNNQWLVTRVYSRQLEVRTSGAQHCVP